MKRSILTLLLAGLMAPAGLCAQRVYKDAGDHIIFDLTKEAGMPSGASTNVTKNGVLRKGGTPLNTPTLPWDADNYVNGPINATVFQKLEIAPMDMAGTNAVPVLTAAGATMTWSDAYVRCRDLSHNGVIGWRLPTQRELLLIYVFFNSTNSVIMTDLTNLTPMSSSYWSATEQSSQYTWGVVFNPVGAGTTSSYVKNNFNRVRCVREVTP